MGTEDPGPGPELKEVRFDFQHEGCWLQETTERYPGLMLVATSLYAHGEDIHMNLTVHASDASDITRTHEDWEQDPRIKKVTKLHEGPNGARFHVRYAWEGTIYPHLLEHTPISLGAIRIAGGVEHYQIIGEEADLKDLVRMLERKGTLRLSSLKDADAPAIQDTAGSWSELTDRQLEALVVAQAGGYYEWPRQRSASELAAELDLSSSAFLDHLRHAEAKVLTGVLQKLRDMEPGRTQAILQRRDRSDADGP